MQRIEICRDGSDFSLPKKSAGGSTVGEAVLGLLDAYLAQSHYLVVLCSRGSLASSYMAHEIQYFLDRGYSHRILLAVTEGTDPASHPEEVFPAPVLEARLHERLWYDLRGGRAGRKNTWKRVRDYGDEIARLAVDLHGDAAGRIYPIWQRQRERVRQWRRLGLLAATVIALGSIAVWGWTRTDTYQASQLVAEAPVSQAPHVDDFVEFLAESDQTDAALKTARAAADPDRRFEALLRVAVVLQKQGHVKEAGSTYLAALSVPRPFGDPDADCLAGAILTGGFSPLVQTMLSKGEDDLLASVTDKILQGGRPQDALRVARSIHGNFMNHRSRALARAAARLPAELARPILEEATGNDFRRNDFFGRAEIVQGFLRLGEFDRVWQIAEQVDYEPGSIFSSLALWAAERGDLGRARKALARAPGYRDSVVLPLLEGRTREALALARDPGPDIASRVNSLLAIADHLRKSGHRDDAVPLLREAQLLSGKDESLWRWRLGVAEAMANAGELQAAGRLQDQVAEEAIGRKNWSAAVETLLAMAKLGRPSTALVWLRALEGRVAPQTLLPEIAGAFAEMSDGPAAFDLARRLVDPSDLCEKLVVIFTTKARVPEIKRAAQCIDDIDRRSAALLQALRDLCKENKIAEATEIFAAIPEIPGLTGRDDRRQAIQYLAPTLAHIGQVNAALDLASKLEPRDRIVTLAAVAASLTLHSSSRRAEIASQILRVDVHGSAVEISNAWQSVANDLEKAGELRLAMQAARKIPSDFARSAVLSDIAKRTAQGSSLLDAREVVRQIPDTQERLNATVAVLRAWRAKSARADRASRN